MGVDVRPGPQPSSPFPNQPTQQCKLPLLRAYFVHETKASITVQSTDTTAL